MAFSSINAHSSSIHRACKTYPASGMASNPGVQTVINIGKIVGQSILIAMEQLEKIRKFSNPLVIVSAVTELIFPTPRKFIFNLDLYFSHTTWLIIAWCEQSTHVVLHIDKQQSVALTDKLHTLNSPSFSGLRQCNALPSLQLH